MSTDPKTALTQIIASAQSVITTAQAGLDFVPPPPPAPTPLPAGNFDILDFLVLPDQSKGIVDASGKPYSRQTHGMTNSPGLVGGAGPAWDVVDFTLDAEGYFKRYRVKANHILGPTVPAANVGGWPWDITRISKTVCLDWITELGWASPKDFKKNVANYKDPATGKMTDGKAMFPRFIRGDYNYSCIPTPKAQTEYHMFTNCVWDNKPHFLGDNLQILFGPIWFDHGGTIGSVPTLVHQFLWGGDVPGVFTTKEENLYAYHYSWTRWTLSTLDPTSGMFKVNKVSRRDMLLAQAPPAVVFPCT
jgi:hypothetical protein